MMGIKWWNLLISAVLIIALSSCAQPTPEEEIQATLDEMIQVLESGEKHKIVTEYANLPPDQDIKPEDFSNHKAEQLLNYLNQAKTRSPIISDDQKTIRFKIPASRKDLIFTKVDGRWKLNN